ncbi:MAG: Ger(x)C family spore germination protein [Clostridia bacterium]|nr:Ger(x)C family spore germination protein [Clostridia bacterium]
MRRIISLVLTIILLVSSTGCWGKRELNEISIVSATGIDVENDGSIRMTVLAVTPISSGKEIAANRSSTWIGTATGTNITEAGKNLRSIATKRLAWFHNSVIIISEKAARRGIKEFLDYFVRNREFRLENYVLIADRSALETLQIPADIEKNLPAEINGLIDNIDEWSKSYVSKLKDLLVNVSSSNCCSGIVTGKFGYTESERNTFSTARELYKRMTEDDKRLGIAYLEGSAVIRGDKMTGWMSGNETRGYMWITDKVKPGSIVVKGNESEGSLVMENMRNETNIDVDMINNRFIATIKVKVLGTLMEETLKVDLNSGEVMERLENAISGVIVGEMQAAVNKAQKDFKTDIFDFGGYVERKYPKLWKKVKDDWSRLFSEMEVKFEVDTTIRRSGKITSTVYSDIR